MSVHVSRQRKQGTWLIWLDERRGSVVERAVRLTEDEMTDLLRQVKALKDQ